jgi:putative SOS response-associated peptidase YedK
VCGRITLTSKPSRLQGIEGPLHFEFWPGPRYNIAPAESVATILNDGALTVSETRWGSCYMTRRKCTTSRPS